MTEHDAARVIALFDALVELPPAAQQTLLNQECANDPELLAELRDLLAADQRVGAMTARPIADELAHVLLAAAPESPFSKLRVGPFEVREELGHGGMGVVYRAERVDGSVAQQVAIKFVRRELLSSELRARFLLERQTLAAMDHPNIARLIDAAELDDGSPYYVMEYVNGVPITDYCERLSIRERIALFRTVCDAVAYAHRNLVVHRDLKPGNILVTANAVPKLLDFGIAKLLLTDGATNSAEQTATAHRYFSPQYAAPEQLLGEPISVGCDVYALGLLLCECLTGHRAFDFANLSAGQIERLITSVPPSPPSQIAARHGAPAQLQRQLRGDLDGIVLRCLRKSVHERYASVEQLAADLENYLHGRPVQARGGHLWYRTRKFVRRNWVPVSTGSVAVLALIGGVVAFATQARIAERRAAELEQVAAFQAEMLSQINLPQAGAGLRADARAKLEKALADLGISAEERDEQMLAFSDQLQRINPADLARDLIDRTILQPATIAIAQQFTEQPRVMASLSFALASRYDALGLHSSAMTLYHQALELQRETLGANHSETLSSETALGMLLLSHNELDAAEVRLEKIFEILNRHLGMENAQTLEAMQNLATLRQKQAKPEEAIALARRVVAIRTRLLGEEHSDTLKSKNNLALALITANQYSEAEELHKNVLDVQRRVLGEDHILTLRSINNYGAVLYHQGQWAQAVPYAREVYEKRRVLLGEEHPDTLTALLNLGEGLRYGGERAEAEVYMRESLKRSTLFWGDAHPYTLAAMNNLGMMLAADEKFSEGEPYVRKALLTEQRVFGANHPYTLRTSSTLGLLLTLQEKFDEAEPFLIGALAGRRSVLGETHSNTLRSVNNVGALRVSQGRFAEVLQLYEPYDEPIRKSFADGNAEHLCRYLTIIGEAETGLTRFAEAQDHLLEANDVCQQGPNTTDREKLHCVKALVGLYTQWNLVQPNSHLAQELEEWTLKLEQP